MNEPHAPAPETVRAVWERLQPAILTEWPQVAADALAATEGELDAVVAVVAEATDRTQLWVRRHLAELVDLLAPPRSRLEERLQRLLERLEGMEPLRERAQEAAAAAKEAMHEVETRAEDFARDVRTQFPKAEGHLRDNLWTSLLGALGLGLIIGLLWGTSRAR
jgi:ElaB/YqjD/DUF883 family membrane-anchored ribosome-binding protein